MEWFTYDKFLGFSAPVPLMLAAGSSAFFVALIFVIAPLIAPRSQSGLQMAVRLRKIHNIALLLFSALSCASAFWWLRHNGELGLGVGGLKPMACNEAPQWMRVLNYAFIVSKAWEWVDTVFLVWLKPKAPKSFLHIFHHATTFWLFLIVGDFPGTLKMGLLLNGGVHTLMYAHYAWPFPKPLVPMITTLQIAQLCFVMYLWCAIPSICGGIFAEYPSRHFWEFATPCVFGPVYILAFIHFFFKRFVSAAPPRAVKQE